MSQTPARNLKPSSEYARRLWVAGGLLFAVILTNAPPASADSEVVEKTRQLETLRTRIDSLHKKLAAKRGEKRQALKAVQTIELAISETVARLNKINKQLASLHSELGQLQDEQQRASSKLEAQYSHLQREARSAYAIGRQHRVKLLLNQQQPAQVGRVMTYYGYLSKARAKSVADIRQQLDHLQAVQVSVNDKREELAALQAENRDRQQQLEQRMARRQRVVTGLERELVARGGDLARLKKDEKQLGELIISLRAVLADIPGDRLQGSLKTQKGKLTWPARGKLVSVFGTRLQSTGLKASGVLISAPEGGQVRAISHGRVAFADWLRGFGLLLIIDHGDGYMSLYGHNQSLYKEVGEWVDTGEVVAVLGRSGGFSRSALYFELRYRGQPVDPAKWCAGKPGSVTG